MIGENFFRERFVVRERQPARIATGIGLLQQFKVADDVLVEERLAFEVFEKVEGNVRLVFFDSAWR